MSAVTQSTRTEAMPALFGPAMLLMTGRLLGFIVAFTIPMVLVRVFTQEDFGTYKQLFLIFGTLFGVAQLGMAESLYYFLPRDSRRSGRYLLNSLSMLALLGLVFMGLLWLLQDHIAQWLNNPELVGHIPYIGVYMLFMLMAVVLEIVMTARRQHMAASCTYALSDFLRALLFIAPAVLFADLQLLLLGAIVFAALRFGATLLYLRKEFKTELVPDRLILRRHLHYALPFGLAAAIEVVQMNFHLYVVSWQFDSATFAIYAVACLQLPIVDFLMTSTSNVMMVNMQDKFKAGKMREVVDIWLDATRKMALVLFPMVGALLVLAHQLIVVLFTDAYERSVPIFMIWTLAMAFTALLTEGVLRVFAQMRFLVIQNCIRLFLVAVLIHWFMQQFGLIGAVMATLVAVGVVKVIALARIRTIMEVSLQRLLPWKALATVTAITVGAAIPAMLLKSLLVIPHFPLLLITALVYSLCYYFLLLRYGPMDKTEKRMLVQWTEIPVSRLLGQVKTKMITQGQ